MPQTLPKVNAAARTSPSDLSQAFNPSFGILTRLTPLVAKSTLVPHAFGLATSYDSSERGATGGTLHSVTSTSSSSSGFANIGLIQGMWNKESRQKISSRNHKLEWNLMKQTEHHFALLNLYLKETFQGKEVMNYVMYLYWYKKVKLCEILLAHEGVIHALMTAPFFFTWN